MSTDLQSFIRAIRSGDLAVVREMATADPSLLRATDPQCFGTTTFMCAAQTANQAMIDLLLDLGADINQRSDWWAGSFGVLDSADDGLSEYLISRGAVLTPHSAARLGKITELRSMLDADRTVGHSRGGDGQTPLHFARTIQIADLLLEHGAVIDALDIDHGSTPAQWLSEARPEVAAHLVLRGAVADPFLAARIGDISLLEKLLSREPDGLNVRVSRSRFSVPPPAAGHIYLYSMGEGCTLVHAAAGSSQMKVIHWLATHGADINAGGGYDNGTALHASAWGDRAESVKALLDVGADINAVSGHLHRNEPIGWAIVSGAVSAFQVLLERGAAIRPHHFEDAKMGVEGAFREVNPRRPMVAWKQILDVLSRK